MRIVGGGVGTKNFLKNSLNQNGGASKEKKFKPQSIEQAMRNIEAKVPASRWGVFFLIPDLRIRRAIALWVK
jgi:hypothetical protein